MAPPLYVDISSFQPSNIDWVAYRKWAASFDGVARACFRVCDSATPDSHFQAYRKNAIAAGVDILIYYQYVYPQYGKPIAQANFLQSTLGSIRPYDKLMLDYEEGDPAATADWAVRWLEQQQLNYTQASLLYAADSYIRSRLQDQRLPLFDLVLAKWEFTPNERPPCPPPWSHYNYVQFTDSMSGIPGINVPVDANVYLGPERSVIVLTSHGEVADFPDISQFEPGESEFECGFFSVGECLYAGQVGKGSQGTGEQVDVWADTHGGINTGGVSTDDMHNLFHQAGLQYLDITAINPTSHQVNDELLIRSSLALGYPVIVTIPEQPVIDVDLGGNPYAPNWTPSGNHIITITGFSNSNYIVHDTAAIVGGIFGKIASQPRRYLATSLHISWAAQIRLPWLPALGGTTVSGVPIGWKDDGKTLTSPNGKRATLGFRNYILTHAWDAADVILREDTAVAHVENYWTSGAGNILTCNYTRLGYTTARGVYKIGIGNELVGCEAALAKCEATQPTGGVPQVIVDDVSALSAFMTPAANAFTKLLKDSGLQP